VNRRSVFNKIKKSVGENVLIDELQTSIMLNAQKVGGKARRSLQMGYNNKHGEETMQLTSFSCL
jgi:hypothetical protein